MTWISSCAAPDLSGLEQPLLANYILNVTFLGHSISDTPRIRAWSHVFIVCVDKAVRYYCEGRRKLVDYVGSSNKTSLLIAGLADFETCINTTKRCLRLVERLASDREAPHIERSQRRLLQSFSDEITRTRDALEHMDERIAAMAHDSGEPQLLCVTRDGVALIIGAERIEFERLAACLRHLHSLATTLARPSA